MLCTAPARSARALHAPGGGVGDEPRQARLVTGRIHADSRAMEWTDHGILLTVRPHGESAAIIDVFTEVHGRHSGIVRGGTSRKLAPVLQPGAQVQVEWRARLEDHLGTYHVEPVRSRAAVAMGDRLTLAGLNAVLGLVSFCSAGTAGPRRVLYTHRTPAGPVGPDRDLATGLSALGTRFAGGTGLWSGPFRLCRDRPDDGLTVRPAQAGPCQRRGGGMGGPFAASAPLSAG